MGCSRPTYEKCIILGRSRHYEVKYPDSPPQLKICRGYSRDRPPDLKQFLMTLVCSRDSGIPLSFSVSDGNRNDEPLLREILQKFQREWNFDGRVVADAALYSAETLQQMQGFSWISRVPQTLKAAKELVQSPREAEHLKQVPCSVSGYRLWECFQTYGGVEQRWILVESSRRAGKSPDLEKVTSADRSRQTYLRRQWRQLQQLSLCL